MKRASRLKTFKVVLLIDRVETEVMFIEAANVRDAGRIVTTALIDGKSYEKDEWALQISEHGLAGKIGRIPIRKHIP